MQRYEASSIPATGIGSMPGTRSQEAARIVAGEFDIPHVAELPARGPGADMIGRTLSLVATSVGDFNSETTPDGWRLLATRSGAVGGQMRRGASWLGEDLDRLEVELAGFTGRVKTQVAGPWTLAASVEAARGTRLVADRGACADLAGALSEALAGHIADLARRVPGARVVVQVDEPSLSAVLGGRVRSPSGRGALRTPELAEAVAVLGQVREAAAGSGAAHTVVHSCARGVPLEVLLRAGFQGVSVDALGGGRALDKALGGWWDSGGIVVLGVVPAMGERGPSPREVASSVTSLWSRIGFGMADLAERTWLSPTCGMAGASPAWARAAGGRLREAARLLESAA